MTRFCFWIACCIIPFSFCKAQRLSDTSFIVGKLKSATSLYRQAGEYCSGSSPKYLAGSPSLVIAGVKTCSSSFNNALFYDVIYKGEHFFADTNTISLAGFTVKDFSNLNEDQKNSFIRNAERKERAFYDMKKGQLDEATGRAKRAGMLILNWGTDSENQYSNGTGAHFTIYNLGPKEIKYIYFNVKGYDTRGHRIVDNKSNRSIIELRGMGPVKPGDTRSFSFNTVWPSSLVQNPAITSLKIVYVDGSDKEVSAVEKLILDQDLYAYFFSDGGH